MLQPSLRGALATKQSIEQHKERKDCFASLAMTGFKTESYGGGGFAIGFFCASAATVDVPIGPCSS